ncbi:MAG: hypothetical protein M3133_07880 [Actinomycetota bacterium]|nr:hypothetical protein [Actinomycetota bacterium]
MRDHAITWPPTMRDALTSKWGRILQAVVGLVLIIGGTTYIGGDEGAVIGLLGLIPCVSDALKLGERPQPGTEAATDSGTETG